MVALQGNDGKLYDVPEADAQEALASGAFKPAQQTAPQAPQQDEEPKGLGTATETPMHVKEAPTVQLKNQQTGELEPIPENQADQAVVSGSHAPVDLPLVGDDGKLYQVPDDDAKEAIASGKFRLSTLADRNAAQHHKDVEQAVSDELDKPGSTLSAVATGISKHNPLVNIAEAFDSPEDKEIAEEIEKQTKEKDPTAYYTGAGLGEVGSAVGLGAAGKGVAGALGLGAEGASLASKLGAQAVEGAVFSAEPVAQDIINKDYKGAAEHLAVGIGGNIALHGLFSGVSALGGEAKELANKALGGAEEATGEARPEDINAVGKALGMTPKEIADNGSALPDLLKAAKIDPKAPIEESIDKALSLGESGPRIGKAIKALDELPEKDQIIRSSLSDVSEKVKQLVPGAAEHFAADEAISSAKELVGKTGLSAEEKLAAKEALQDARKWKQSLAKLSPMDQEAYKALNPLLEQLKSTAKEGTFDATQKAKAWFGNRVDWRGDQNIARLTKSAASLLREGLIGAEDQAAKKLGESGAQGVADIVSGLRQDRAAYNLSKIFGTSLERRQAKLLPGDAIQSVMGMRPLRSGAFMLVAHSLLHLPGPMALAAGLGLTAAKKALEQRALSEAMQRLIGEGAKPATTAVLEAMGSQEKAISEGAKGLLDHFASGKAAGYAAANHGLQSLLPGSPVGLTHQKQLETVRNAVTATQADPAKFAANIQPVVQTLKAEGLDQVADEYTQHQLRLMKVLQTVLPKDPAMDQAHPFAAKVAGEEISPETKSKYQRALTVATDPTHLFEMMKDNSITATDVAIAAAVNPNIIQKMRIALTNEGLKNKPDLSYQQRLSLGIMMGTNLDESTSQVPALQSVYPAPTPSANASNGASKKKMPAKAQDNLANSYLTTSQKAAKGS
jgi:hypothetical protein